MPWQRRRASTSADPAEKTSSESEEAASLSDSSDSVFSSTLDSGANSFPPEEPEAAAMGSSQRKECYLHPASNLLSQATFNWLNPLLWRGYWKPLEQEDLGLIPASEKSIRLGNRLGRLIRQQIATAGLRRLSLWRCYWSFSWSCIILGGCLKFAGDLVGYVAPLGIEVIVNYLNASSTSTGQYQPPIIQLGTLPACQW